MRDTLYIPRLLLDRLALPAPTSDLRPARATAVFGGSVQRNIHRHREKEKEKATSEKCEPKMPTKGNETHQKACPAQGSAASRVASRVNTEERDDYRDMRGSDAYGITATPTVAKSIAFDRRSMRI